MAVTINNFNVSTSDNESGATLMPKLAYRFRVDFNGLGGNPSSTTVTRNVISCGRPSLTHEEITVDAYNSKIYLAGKHAWNTIDITFRDDVDSNVIKQLGNQMNKQVDHNAQSSAFSGMQYKFNMSIATLDGSNDGNGNAQELDRWDLVGCFITNIQYGDLNYGSGSEMVQVTCTIRYDNAAHEIVNGKFAGQDVMSGKETGTANTDERTSTKN